jgi:hypothetical protein
LAPIQSATGSRHEPCRLTSKTAAANAADRARPAAQTKEWKMSRRKGYLHPRIAEVLSEHFMTIVDAEKYLKMDWRTIKDFWQHGWLPEPMIVNGHEYWEEHDVGVAADRIERCTVPIEQVDSDLR